MVGGFASITDFAREPAASSEDLGAALQEAWRHWLTGAADRRSPFHAPICATVSLRGAPRARVVTLRACDPTRRMLRFHADRRSDKFAELVADPALALTAYDPALKVQLRAEGRASLHLDDAVADAAWAGARPMSRITYGESPGPGATLASGGAYSLPATPEEVEAGRAHFCVVAIEVAVLEWLHLAHSGHRRARFEFTADEARASWLAP